MLTTKQVVKWYVAPKHCFKEGNIQLKKMFHSSLKYEKELEFI